MWTKKGGKKRWRRCCINWNGATHANGASRVSDVASARERAKDRRIPRSHEHFERETYSGHLRALIRQTVLRVVRDAGATTIRATPISSLFPRYHPARGKVEGLSLPCLSPPSARDSSHGPGSSHLVPRTSVEFVDRFVVPIARHEKRRRRTLSREKKSVPTNAHSRETPGRGEISRLIEKEIIFYASATPRPLRGDPITQGKRHSRKTTEQIIVIVTIVGSNLRVELIHPRGWTRPLHHSPATSQLFPSPTVPSLRARARARARLIIARIAWGKVA